MQTATHTDPRQTQEWEEEFLEDAAARARQLRKARRDHWNRARELAYADLDVDKKGTLAATRLVGILGRALPGVQLVDYKDVSHQAGDGCRRYIVLWKETGGGMQAGTHEVEFRGWDGRDESNETVVWGHYYIARDTARGNLREAEDDFASRAYDRRAA